MARRFLTAIDLGKNELQNAAVQNLASAPASPVKGQLYYNSTGGDDTLYWYNGTAWIAAKSSAGISPASTVTDLVPGGAQAVGSSTLYARQDHVHGGIPGAGASTAVTTFGATKADGAATTYARSDHTHGSPAHDAAAHNGIPLSALSAPTVDVSMGGFKLTNVGAPTAVGDAASKSYVDNAVAGLSWKEPVRIATTANIATLTGLAAIDGVTPVANDRVLVKDQTTTNQNGIYLAQSGAWTRSTDADQVGDLEGAAAYVLEGTANAGKAYVVTTTGAITPGTTNVTWTQFGGGSAIVAGNGLTLTGNTLNVIPLNGSLTVNADDISVAYGGTGGNNGSAVTAARSDHLHDGVYTRKFSQDCAAATSTTVTHNLNTRDVDVTVYLNSGTYDEVDCDIQRTSVNVVTVLFAVAPAAGAYRIVVMG